MVCILPDCYKNSVADAYGLEAEQLKDDTYRSVIASMLRIADFGIHSLLIREAEPLLALQKGNGHYNNIDAVHIIQDENGNAVSYALPMSEESDGTNSYFRLIGVIKRLWIREPFWLLMRLMRTCIRF